MSVATCEIVRELIPDHAAGRLGPNDVVSVERHLELCGECRAELDLARLVFASRSVAPDGLVASVEEAVRNRRAAARRPWWGLTAAAVAALALGINMASNGSEPVDTTVPGYAYELEDTDLWLSADGLIAGAPTLEGLSDEALAQLLEELMVGGSGGAA